MIKVSVIVPVYNVEEYLERCLKSLVNQTLKDIEIIVVNDGTKDNSQKIIDKYAKKYKFVKSYIKENGGLSSARNYGLKYATGEYIGFVDSDDYVDENMFKDMYDKAISKNFDVVVCDLDYVYDNKIVYASSNIKHDLLKKDDIKKSMINVYPTVSNKIYNKRLFNFKLEFKNNVWYEDVEFLYRLYPYINSIGVIKKPYYKYVQRAGAITSTFDERVFHYIENWNGILKFYIDNNFFNEYAKEIEYSYVRYLFATFIKTAAKFPDSDMYDKAVEEAIENVKMNFPHYRRNKYFYKSIKGIYLLLFNRLIAKVMYTGGNK